MGGLDKVRKSKVLVQKLRCHERNDFGCRLYKQIFDNFINILKASRILPTLVKQFIYKSL